LVDLLGIFAKQIGYIVYLLMIIIYANFISEREKMDNLTTLIGRWIMQEQNTINYDELATRGRKLQAEAIYEAFRRGLMLMKKCLSKKSASSSPRKELAAPTGHTLA